MVCKYFLIFVISSAILLSGVLSSAEETLVTKEKTPGVTAPNPSDKNNGSSEETKTEDGSQPQTRDAGYQYPPPPAVPVEPSPLPAPAIPVPPFPGVFPGGFPFPFFPGLGLNGGFNAALDFGLGGYYPVLEKLVAVVGGGILILLFLLLVSKFLFKIGVVPANLFGLDFSSATAKAAAGSIDLGPIHASGAASGSIAVDDPVFIHRVQQGIDRRF